MVWTNTDGTDNGQQLFIEVTAIHRHEALCVRHVDLIVLVGRWAVEIECLFPMLILLNPLKGLSAVRQRRVEKLRVYGEELAAF